MSFKSVVPKPVYAMVDLDKKRKDRSKIYTDVRVTEQGPADSNLSTISENRGVSTQEATGVNLLPSAEASAVGVMRPTKSSYTMIMQETLLPPQGAQYEDTNISTNVSKGVPNKGGTSPQKFWFCVIGLVLLFLCLAMLSGLALTIVQITELKTQIDSLQNTPDISELMQSISELRANQSQIHAALMELRANQSQIHAALMELRANQSHVSADQTHMHVHASLMELRANQSQIHVALMELRAIQSQIHAALMELRANQSCLIDQHQHNLIDILEQLGQPSSPAPPCAALLAFSPSIPSGHYWVRAGNGSAVRVYCDMTRSCGGVTGGWMRVASLDFSNSSTLCPSGLRERMDSGIRTCGIQSSSPTCASVLFSTGGIMYNKVCGKILAYQVGIPNAFGINHFLVPNVTIDSFYVDGISLTHGSNPREHIWTFAAARDETGLHNNGKHVCECSYNPGRDGGTPPSYVGRNYFCDSGSSGYSEESRDRFYSASPLWDGSGCGPNSTCCSFNSPPWFYRQLPCPTSDAIEMRVCSSEGRDNEDIAMSSVELFVQ